MGMLGGLFALVPHPDTPPSQVEGVYCTLTFANAGNWSIGFTVTPKQTLVLPAPVQPQRQDGLWQHTCFELFVRDCGSEAYLEFNLSPSGCWAAYVFDAYRAGQRELAIGPISITTSVPEQFALGMRQRLHDLGLDEESIAAMLAVPLGDNAPSEATAYALNAISDTSDIAFAADCTVGISAVIEEQDGTKSYWALAHPPGAPDFHHPTCFAATLPAPSKP
jgi:hypothetical protein